MKTIKVGLGINSYDIHVGSGLLEQIGTRLKENGFGDNVVVITDSVVKKLYSDTVKQNLSDSGFNVLVLEVPEGEEQKSLEAATGLYDGLTASHAERTTSILALGGGVIGDLAGFVAATYLRGVPLIQVPTTLLAQVDSSIGGKVAVNHGLLKNNIGMFYQPQLVISDITTLKTLTPKEISEGLAEVIKYGVIQDEDFFIYIERNIDRIKSLDEVVLENIVFNSAKIKAEVVGKDERDLGLRNILNYGHTIGHAIESVSNFEIRHGEAVAIGMLVAARISNEMGIIGKDEVDRLKNVITRAVLPTEIPDLDLGDLLQSMSHDKKILQGKIRFVLPKSIGEVFVTDQVSNSIIERVLVN